MRPQRPRLYFDYAASTPVDPRVLRAMQPYFTERFGNPGSLHSFGQEAIAAVDRARETIAGTLGAEFRDIIFTGSATEANNLALRGTLLRFREQFPNIIPRLIVSSIEHESVLETARDFGQSGVELVVIPVSRDGVIDMRTLERAFDANTVLVSVMYANNEVGTIQPIADIARTISRFREKNHSHSYPLLHTDAAQAFQFLDCDVTRLGVDLMTLSAHKIYGPKGVGVLYARNRSLLLPFMIGGGQEFGMRSGTENVPLIAGFGEAAALVEKDTGYVTRRIGDLRDYFWRELKKMYPRAQRNGSVRTVLPNILNVSFPNYEAQDLLTFFDLHGVAVSAGSACSSRSFEPSYVIRALGHSRERARRSVRFSFGRPTTREEILSASRVIKRCLREYKK